MNRDIWLTCTACGNKYLYKGVEDTPSGKRFLGFYPFCSLRCKYVDLLSWLDDSEKSILPPSESELKRKKKLEDEESFERG